MTTRRWGSLALAALAAGYAVLAVASGVDRSSLRSEVPGRLAPPPIRAQLYRQDARLALQQGRLEAAALAAALAVRAEPSEPGSTAGLGAALFARKDYAGADRAYRVAGKLGWRDLPTQAYLLLAALAFDDRAAAAQRLDAIMRVAPDLPAAHAAVSAIESDARGQAALLARLEEGPHWLTPYARAAAELPAPAFANRLSLIERAAVAGQRPDCTSLADPVNMLAFERGRFDEARRLWASGCAPGRGRQLLNNASFDQPLAEPATPFDWTLPGAGGVSAGIEQGALVARNDDLIRRAVAHQYLLLPAGEVTIMWDAAASADAAPLRDLVHLLCPDGSSALEQDDRTGGTLAKRFMVSASCRPQRLEIRLDRAAGDVRVEGIRIAGESAPAAAPAAAKP